MRFALTAPSNVRVEWRAASSRVRSRTQWNGLPPLLYGIVMCQIGNWSCPIHEQGGVRHEGYNEWNRCGKERVAGSRCGRARQGRAAPADSPLAAAAVLQQ